MSSSKISAVVGAMPNPAEFGFDPYADATGDVSGFFSDIVKGVGKAAKGVASVAKKVGNNPIVKTAVSAARTALKNTGPIGMVANGAISAMDAGFSGKNIGQIATAAAIGAAPSGIDTAMKAGFALARGDNVLNTAVKAGADTFLKGSGERFGYSVAIDALKKGASKVDLGATRRALATEGQRRAFDSAVGTVAKTVVKVAPKLPPSPKGKPIMRALSSGRPTARPVTTITPRGTIPTSGKPPLLVKSHAINKNRLVRWKRLSPKAASFILSRVPHAPRFSLIGNDTSALTPDGKIYIVESGDFPGRIAQKLTGSSSRFGELYTANPQKPTVVVNGVRNFKTLFAGERLNVPTSWQSAAPAPVITIPTTPVLTVPTTTDVRKYVVLSGDNPSKIAVKFTGVASRYVELIRANPQKPTVTVNGVINFKTLFAGERLNIPASWPDVFTGLPQLPAPVIIPTPVISTVPSPSGTAPNIVDSASIIQAKAILVAWSKSDGIAEHSIPDYGVKPEDMSTSITLRDKSMITAFARWNNRIFKTFLNVTGDLTPPVADALRLWAEKKAVSAGIPSLPTAVPTPTQSSPGIPQLPPATLPTFPSQPVTPTLPAVVTSPGQPITTLPPGPVASQPKKDDTLLMGAGGAVIGFLMGGPAGALIGGALGAFGAKS